MTRQFQKEDGLTLAELLATIAITSLITILITSVIVIVQKQYTSQKEDALQLTDITIAAKVITKDIRTHEIKEVIPNQKIEFIDGNKYEFDAENNILKRNDVDYIFEINRFEIDARYDVDDVTKIKKVILLIESNSGQKLETEIIVR